MAVNLVQRPAEAFHRCAVCVWTVSPSLVYLSVCVDRVRRRQTTTLRATRLTETPNRFFARHGEAKWAFPFARLARAGPSPPLLARTRIPSTSSQQIHTVGDCRCTIEHCGSTATPLASHAGLACGKMQVLKEPAPTKGSAHSRPRGSISPRE